MAPRLEITIVRMIVDVLSENGVKRDIRNDEMKDRMISMQIGLEVFAGGMMMARNMPNKATDKADTILAGRMVPITMPNAVPIAQQGDAKLMAP